MNIKTEKTKSKFLSATILSFLVILTVFFCISDFSYAQAPTPLPIDNVETEDTHSFNMSSQFYYARAYMDNGGLTPYTTVVFKLVPYNSAVVDEIYAYCIDLYTPVVPTSSPNDNQIYKLEELEKLQGDYANKEDKLRTIITHSYPYLDISEVQKIVPNITPREAVHATQIIIWETIHGGKGIYKRGKFYYTQLGNKKANKTLTANESKLDEQQRVYDLYTYLKNLPVSSAFTKKAKLEVTNLNLKEDSDSDFVNLTYQYKVTEKNSDGSLVNIEKQYILNDLKLNSQISTKETDIGDSKFLVEVSIPKKLFLGKNNEPDKLDVILNGSQDIDRVDAFFAKSGNKNDTQTLISAKDLRQKVNFKANKTIYFRKAEKGYLDFIKKDSKTSSPLAGSKVEIRDKRDNLLLSATTDENGKLKKSSAKVGAELIDDVSGKIALNPGNYYYIEVEAPAEYELDSTKYDFSITSKNTQTAQLTNKKIDKTKSVDPSKGNNHGLVFKKIDYDNYEKTRLSNGGEIPNGYQGIGVAEAQIVVKRKSDSTTVFEGKTDLNGYLTKTFSISGVDIVPTSTAPILVLPTNETYIVEEKVAPNGYLQNDEKFEFTINNNEDLVEILGFTNLKEVDNGKLIIEKMTTDSTHLQGATFALYKKKNYEKTPRKSFLQFKTDVNGKPTQDDAVGRVSLIQADGSILLYPREEGTDDSYVLVEIKAPDGYALDETPIYFGLKYNSLTFTKSIVNEKGKGTFDFTKTSMSSGEPVAGATMQIYRESDNALILEAVTDARGKFDKANATTGVDLINSNGSVNLEIGKYYFKEINAPDGYLLNKDRHDFEIKYNEVTIDILSDEDRGEFDFTKVDFSTSNPIPGVTMEIYNKDTDELVFKGITDARGKFEISTVKIGKKLLNSNGNILLKDGDYYFIEKDAPQEYIVSSEKHNFTIKVGEPTKEDFKNELKPAHTPKNGGQIFVTKVDASTGNPIKDATISFYKRKDENDNTGVLLVSAKTDEKGALVKDSATYGKSLIDKDGRVSLDIGLYYFVETNAPSGYKLNAEKHFFEITKDGEFIADNLLNEVLDPTNPSSSGGIGGGSSSGGKRSSPKSNDKDKPDKDNPNKDKPTDKDKPKDSKNPKNDTDKPNNNDNIDPNESNYQDPQEPQEPQEPQDPNPYDANNENNTPKIENENSKTNKNEGKNGKINVSPGSYVEVKEAPKNGTVIVEEDGSWYYVPKSGFVGKDKFVVKVKDPDGNEKDVNVDIEVLDEDVPLGNALPKTGQNDFSYLLGLSFIAIGLRKYINRRK